MAFRLAGGCTFHRAGRGGCRERCEMARHSLGYQLKSYAASIETYAKSQFRVEDLRRFNGIDVMGISTAAPELIRQVASEVGLRKAAELRRMLNDAEIFQVGMSRSYLYGNEIEQKHALAQIDLRGEALAEGIRKIAQHCESTEAAPEVEQEVPTIADKALEQIRQSHPEWITSTVIGQRIGKKPGAVRSALSAWTKRLPGDPPYESDTSGRHLGYRWRSA